MASTEPWDCIVVGAGINGSWTAYHLAQQGVRTLLLEQFALPHNRGGSNGQSRIIRMTDNKVCYAEMMPECYDWWRTLERECGKEILVTTGILVIQGGDQAILKQSLDTMQRCNMPGELIDSREMRKRYPMFDFPDDHGAVMDQTGGLLRSNRCLNVLHNLFVAKGGKIIDGSAVTSITPGGVTTVGTPQGTYTTRRLVLAPGPWATELLAKINIHVPVKAMPGRSAYWRDTNSTDRYTPATKTPVTIHETAPRDPSEKYRFYCLFPTLEYPGLVKIVTRGEPPPRYVHPDARDKDEKGEMLELLSEYIPKHFQGLETKPSIIEPCVYSMTPDKNYIIDYHPRHPNIVFACGFSGTGFKTSPVVGKMLAEMVQGKKPSYSLQPFRYDRNYYPNSKL